MANSAEDIRSADGNPPNPWLLPLAGYSWVKVLILGALAWTMALLALFPLLRFSLDQEVTGIPLLVVVGTAVAGIGSSIWAYSFTRLALRLRKCHAAQEEFPDEPWRWQFRNQKTSDERDGQFVSNWSGLGLVFIFVGFLLILIAGLFDEEVRTARFLFVTALFMTLMLGFFAAVMIHTLVFDLFLPEMKRRRTFGKNWLRYVKFPYFYGEEMALQFCSTKGLDSFRDVRFVLHCHDFSIGRGSGANDEESPKVEHYEIFREEKAFDKLDDQGAGEFPILFSIPDASSEIFSGKAFPDYCWRIEIYAERNGRPFEEIYLLPIYPKPQVLNPASATA